MMPNVKKEEDSQEIVAEAVLKPPEAKPLSPKQGAADDDSDALDDYAKASLKALKARKATKDTEIASKKELKKKN